MNRDEIYEERLSRIARTRELEARVSEILRHEWDPIGLGRLASLPANEYDNYARQVVALLRRDATEAKLCAYLEGVARDRMGISADTDRTQKAVRALLSLPRS